MDINDIVIGRVYVVPQSTPDIKGGSLVVAIKKNSAFVYVADLSSDRKDDGLWFVSASELLERQYRSDIKDLLKICELMGVH